MANTKNNSLDGLDKPFAKRLRTLIDENGTSQAKLAKTVGVTRQAISSYTLGLTVPDIEKFEKIADFFDVSFDYLLGRSKNKKSENTDIGLITGLSDEAISQLSQNKDSASFTSVLNYLITEKKLMRYLANYFLGFVFREVQKTKYKLVPLKSYPSPYHTKIMFAQLIEHLPLIGSEIETDFLKDEDLINKLILDYLSKNANISECETCVGLEEVDFEPNNYEPEVEDESEAIYQEHIEQQKAEQESEDNVFEMHDVILDFLSYLGSKNKGVN